MIWGHAFKNIRVQLVTIVALSYGGLLEGAVLTETVFGWPGFGQYLTSALIIGDMNVVRRLHADRRRHLHHAEPAFRHALPPARSEDAMSALVRTREWLDADSAATSGRPARRTPGAAGAALRRTRWDCSALQWCCC